MICNRCGKETEVSTMSYFNTQKICIECSDKERKRPDFKKAVEADAKAIKNGSFNYKGIGLYS